MPTVLAGSGYAIIKNRPVFGLRLRPYLSGSFKQALFVWENQEFNTRIITEYHPKIVTSEVLERFFNVYDPELLMAKEAEP